MRSDPLVVVTAVRPETRAVLEALRNVRRADAPGLRTWHAETRGRSVLVVQAGIGHERARHALAAIAPSHGPVLSVGFAGALVPNAKPGDVALPTCVVWEAEGGLGRYDVPQACWRAADAHIAATHRGTVHHGPILSAKTVVATPDAKRTASQRTGAVAVEMEAAGLVPVARERGTGVVVVRVILDAADVSLANVPVDLDSSWRARTELLGRPWAWSSVWAVARQIPLASRSLRGAMTAVFAAL